MAKSKQKKHQIVDQYVDWFDKSKALVLTRYIGLSVSEIEQLRGNIREAGGEFHVVKNTLAKIAFDKVGLEYEDEQFLQDTAVGFTFDESPLLAKAIVEFAEESEFVQLKAGYFDKERVRVSDFETLARVPPLPVLRAQLLSALLAPSTRLTRILAEPGRKLAGVLKAYSEKEAAPDAV